MEAIDAWKFPREQRYQIVHQSSEDVEDSPPRKVTESRRWVILLTITLLSIIAAITVTLAIKSSAIPLHASTDYSLEVYKAPSLGLNCGSNIREAITLGCTFDILTYSWTPEPCLDRLTSSEFHKWLMSPDLQFGSFPFFYDAEATNRVPDVTALSMVAGIGNSSVFASHEVHLGHCVHLARRISRIAHGQGGRFTEKDEGLPHALHCIDLLLEKLGDLTSGDDGALHSFLLVSFNTC